MYNKILAEFKAHQNPNNAKKMQQYMRNQFVFLGIATPLRRQIIKPYFKNIDKQSNIDWQFIEQCWQSEYREMCYVALGYLRLMKNQLSYQDIDRLKYLAIHHSWWDSIDGLAVIIGDLVLRYPQLTNHMIIWSQDNNFWLRRIAIIHQLLRKNRMDTELLAKIIINNLNQKEFFINKAIGWALRDYAKTNPDWVKTFIHQYQTQMTALSIREASKYLKKETG